LLRALTAALGTYRTTPAYGTCESRYKRDTLVSRACQTGPHSLLYHCALELGKHAHHAEHRAAAWCAGVEPLLVQVEVDLLGVQLLQRSKQIHRRELEAAAERHAWMVGAVFEDAASLSAMMPSLYQPAPQRHSGANHALPMHSLEGGDMVRYGKREKRVALYLRVSTGSGGRRWRMRTRSALPR
jgi:hypothetical protein